MLTLFLEPGYNHYSIWFATESMEPVITNRVIIFGVILFVGICLPLLFIHYSRQSASRLPGWVVAVLAIALFTMPVYRYVADRLSGDDAAPVGSHPLIYKISPTISEWVVEPAVTLVAGVLLGSIGVIIYKVLCGWNPVRPFGDLENGR